MILIKPSFEVLDYPKNLNLIAKAARVCYQSEQDSKLSDAELVSRCIANGHESILEHEKISVLLTVDRGFSHELVRHRQDTIDDDLLVEQIEWDPGISQESTRYCNYGKDKFQNQVTFIIPPWAKIAPRSYSYSEVIYGELTIDPSTTTYLLACSESERYYLQLLKDGKSPQDARGALAIWTKTQIMLSANCREFRAMLNLRAAGKNGKPHPQMLEIMVPMLREFKHLIPIIFDDIKEMEV